MIALFNRLEIPFQNTQRNTEESPRKGRIRCRERRFVCEFGAVRGGRGWFKGLYIHLAHQVRTSLCKSRVSGATPWFDSGPKRSVGSGLDYHWRFLCSYAAETTRARSSSSSPLH